MTTNSDRDAKAKAVRILAKSIYRELTSQGYDGKQIVALATELISEVTASIAHGETTPVPTTTTQPR